MRVSCNDGMHNDGMPNEGMSNEGGCLDKGYA